MFMLSFTAACVAVSFYVPAVKAFLKENNWLIYVGGVGGLILMLISIMGGKKARKNSWPLLISFTIMWSLMITMLTQYYKPEIVLIAAITTAFMTLGLVSAASCAKGEMNFCMGIAGTLALTIFPLAFFLVWNPEMKI